MDESAFDAYLLADALDAYSMPSGTQEMGKVPISQLMSRQEVSLKESIEQQQPKFLEEVHRFNSKMEQNVRIERFPGEFKFAMV
jgi:hypothetical protein